MSVLAGSRHSGLGGFVAGVHVLILSLPHLPGSYVLNEA